MCRLFPIKDRAASTPTWRSPGCRRRRATWQARWSRLRLIAKSDTNESAPYLVARQHAYEAIALAQTQSGDRTAAAKSFEAAKAAAAEMPTTYYKNVAYKEISVSQVQAGEIAAAKATALLISDTPWRDPAYEFIVTAQAKAGDFAEAKATAAQISNNITSGRLDAYVRIAKAQALAGDVTAAKATAAEIASMTWPYKEICVAAAYREIAAAQAQAGSAAEARKTFETAKAAMPPDLLGRDSHIGEYWQIAYRAIAIAQARAGDRADALATVEQIAKLQNPGEESLSETHAKIASALLEAGDPAAALATTEKIKRIDMKIDSLLEIVAAQVKKGDLKQARETLAKVRGAAESAEGETKTRSDDLDRGGANLDRRHGRRESHGRPDRQ